MEHVTESTSPGDPVAKVSKAQAEFDAAIARVRVLATPEDIARAAAVAASGAGYREEVITPTVAAVLFADHNRVNRPFSFARCYGYVEAMKRGEWKSNHQGAAFYPDNTIADSQHRFAASALSGFTLTMPVMSDFNKDSINTIDRAIRRTAGQGLEMLGISDGKLKASSSKVVMIYMSEQGSGTKQSPTDPQIEHFVLENDDTCTSAVALARRASENVSEVCMSDSVATRIALLLLLGGWDDDDVFTFLHTVQEGTTPYDDAPTKALWKLMAKSKLASLSKDRLTATETFALSIKSLNLLSRKSTVAKLTWNPAKEELPSYHVPSMDEEAA